MNISFIEFWSWWVADELFSRCAHFRFIPNFSSNSTDFHFNWLDCWFLVSNEFSLKRMEGTLQNTKMTGLYRFYVRNWDRSVFPAKSKGRSEARIIIGCTLLLPRILLSWGISWGHFYAAWKSWIGDRMLFSCCRIVVQIYFWQILPSFVYLNLFSLWFVHRKFHSLSGGGLLISLNKRF